MGKGIEMLLPAVLIVPRLSVSPENA